MIYTVEQLNVLLILCKTLSKNTSTALIYYLNAKKSWLKYFVSSIIL